MDVAVDVAAEAAVRAAAPEAVKAEEGRTVDVGSVGVARVVAARWAVTAEAARRAVTAAAKATVARGAVRGAARGETERGAVTAMRCLM